MPGSDYTIVLPVTIVTLSDYAIQKNIIKYNFCQTHDAKVSDRTIFKTNNKVEVNKTEAKAKHKTTVSKLAHPPICDDPPSLTH